MKRTRFSARFILFDWDGTLLNSYDADVRAYITMFRAFGIEWGPKEFARHYSPNWYRVYTAARLARAHWSKADALWGRAYRNEKPGLLPGARQVLTVLKRSYILGIVTSGNRARVRRQLREFDLDRHFSARICSEDAAKRKPHPAPLRAALANLHARPDECIYVGDTAEDVQMARRAGVRAIGVLGPFPTAERLRASRPEALLRSIRELPRYVCATTDSTIFA